MPRAIDEIPKAFRSQVPEKLLAKLPKTADGFRASLGMTVFYPYSLDSWMGPHPVVISGMTATHCTFTYDDQEISVTWDSIYWGESNAKQAKLTGSTHVRNLR